MKFGEDEGRGPLDNIAKRAETYKLREHVTYKIVIYRRGKKRFGVTNV